MEAKRKPGRPPKNGIAGRSSAERMRDSREARSRWLNSMGLKETPLIASTENLIAIAGLAKEIGHHPGVVLARLCQEVLTGADLYFCHNEKDREELAKLDKRMTIVHSVLNELRRSEKGAPFIELVSGYRP